MVVSITAVMTLIPYVLYLVKSFGFLLIQLLQEFFIDLFAVSVFTGGIDFKSFVYQILF